LYIAHAHLAAFNIFGKCR